MNNKARITSPKIAQEDILLDTSLRPKKLSDYVGQEKVKENLKIFLQAAKKRKEQLDHILLQGPPGLGKTTLAYIIAEELGVGIKTTSGPAIERQGDVAAILTNLQDRDILFIDEMHRLPRAVEEILYPAMEDYKIDLVIGKGPSAKTLRLSLPKFTIIGATTRPGLLTSPLRSRFGIIFHLEFYTPEELKEIIMRNAKILNIKISQEGAMEIAKRSRGTPRITNRLLKRVRDYADVWDKGEITLDIAKKALACLEIDEIGLDKRDREFLLCIIDKFSGGPVGVETIAASVYEEKDTLEEVYEPYLLQIGFVARTPRGRIATKNAYKHLQREYKYKESETLF